MCTALLRVATPLGPLPLAHMGAMRRADEGVQEAQVDHPLVQEAKSTCPTRPSTHPKKGWTIDEELDESGNSKADSARQKKRAEED